jgi:hypothetical protein
VIEIEEDGKMTIIAQVLIGWKKLNNANYNQQVI